MASEFRKQVQFALFLTFQPDGGKVACLLLPAAGPTSGEFPRGASRNRIERGERGARPNNPSAHARPPTQNSSPHGPSNTQLFLLQTASAPRTTEQRRPRNNLTASRVRSPLSHANQGKWLKSMFRYALAKIKLAVNVSIKD